MQTPGLVIWALPLALTFLSNIVKAGCPNPCELTVQPAELSPELECLSLETRSGGCKCQLSLSVHNDCEMPTDAVGFEFTSCRYPTTNEFEQPCVTVEPQHEGTYHESYTQLGTQQTELALSIDGEQYTVSLEANVTKFNGSGCAFSAPGSGGMAGFSLVGLALVALRRRITGIS